MRSTNIIEQVEVALARLQHRADAPGPAFTATETIDGAVLVRQAGEGDPAPTNQDVWAELQESLKSTGLAVERQDDASGPHLRVWSHLGTGAEPL